ncbi:MAG: FAD-dependent oxidoreductase [Parcubacteria group bacterium]|nr:FAD-dependent oxidoreductase [Parcubacteria group bacterium]
MATKNTSTWLADVTVPSYPKLTKNLSADVVIAGGGITGLLNAYMLAKAGIKVVLLEKDRLLNGATGSTTAFITSSIDTDTPDLIDMFGKAEAKKILESHEDAINLIEKIIKQEKIDCEYMRCSNFAYANDRKEYKALEEEQAALKSIDMGAALSKSAEFGFGHAGVLTTKKQAKYHPLKFLTALLPKLEAMGVEIYEKTEVTDIDGEDTVAVTANGHTVTGEWSITATYHPFNNPKEVFLKKGMYVSHMIELEVPKGKYVEGTYEDQENPYHYFRVDAGKGAKGKDRIIMGGEDHRKEVPVHKKSFKALEEYAEELFGKAYPVIRSWTGYVEEPSDGLALIGEYDPHRILATAFSGTGMTYAAISAQISHDLILGKKNPYIEIYRPDRMPTMIQLWRKGRDYGEEFFRGAVANLFK